MIWTVTWSRVCDVDVLNMHYKTAERVCMAVAAFAADGSGHVDVDDPEGASGRGRIRARGGYAIVRFIEREARIDVLRIRPNTPGLPSVALLGAAPRPPPDD
jgi:hypothetical protein